MTRMSVKAASVFSFLALAAAPALACEDHSDAAMSGIYGITTTAPAPMDPAPRAQTPRSAQSALHDEFPDIGFGKWWIGD